MEATRKLLKTSTDAQEEQIKIAALTALLSSNLAKIDLLKSEQNKLLEEVPNDKNKIRIKYYYHVDMITYQGIQDNIWQQFGSDELQWNAARKIIDNKFTIHKLELENYRYKNELKGIYSVKNSK